MQPWPAYTLKKKQLKNTTIRAEDNRAEYTITVFLLTNRWDVVSKKYFRAHYNTGFTEKYDNNDLYNGSQA